MSFGPDPWLQKHWDARAAGNFVFGGAGSGVLAFVLSGAVPAESVIAATLAGGALVAAGLGCVFLEIGRKLRAFKVFFNPFTSWMAREAFTSLPLFACVLLALVTGERLWAQAAGAVALVYVYCQGRILQAARGVPAWREPVTAPLVVATGLAEGAGLGIAGSVIAGAGAGAYACTLLVLVVLARVALCNVHRRRVATALAKPALVALARAGRVLVHLGTVAPLVLLALALALPAAAAGLALTAGLAALAGGWYWKFTLVTRAAYNQGFALAHVPVRGSR